MSKQLTDFNPCDYDEFETGGYMNQICALFV